MNRRSSSSPGMFNPRVTFFPKRCITFEWTWRIWLYNAFKPNSRKIGKKCKMLYFLLTGKRLFEMSSAKLLALAYLGKKSTHAWVIFVSILLKTSKIFQKWYLLRQIHYQKCLMLKVVMICHLIGQNIVFTRKWCNVEDQQEVTWSFEVFTPD